MSFTLSNMIEAAARSLGQVDDIVATGGSTTTVVCSTMGTRYQDDAVKDGFAIITRDAGGANGAPEGELQRISAYLQSSTTFTVDTAFTTAPAAGDFVAICKAFYPLATMKQLANDALRSLGDIPLVDTSLTTATNQTEYGWALAWKRKPPTQIQISVSDNSDDYQWRDLYDWYTVPAAPGSTGLIVFRTQPTTGKTLKIWYTDRHPVLSVYNSPVAETINPELAVSMLVEKALEWQNSRTQGSDPFLMQRWNDAKARTVEVKQMFKVWKTPRKARMFEFTRH